MFTDISPYCCEWLTNLFDDKIICCDIRELSSKDCESRSHFFAGIGGWELALQLSGWQGPVWTGSCPCQPFSKAGKQLGVKDERHLWPKFYELIDECRPPAIFGEQVATNLGFEWFARVRSDLENSGYAVGAADLCAASVGAPHIRQRLFWGAVDPSRLDNTCCVGSQVGRAEQATSVLERGSRLSSFTRSDTVVGRDSRYRRIESGVLPLAHRLSHKVGRMFTGDRKLQLRAARTNKNARLTAYGGTIVLPVAATFILAMMESLAQ